MTAQEVWEVWKDNPKKIFKRSDCETTVKLVENRPHFGNADCFMRIDYFLNNDWQPVDEWKEATFLEAIEAWVNGSKIKSVYCDNEFIFQSEFLRTRDSLQTLDLNEARTYKWYIKE